MADQPGISFEGLGLEALTKTLQQLQPTQLTNGVVFDVYQCVKTSKTIKWSDILPAFETIFRQQLSVTPLVADMTGLWFPV